MASPGQRFHWTQTHLRTNVYTNELAIHQNKPASEYLALSDIVHVSQSRCHNINPCVNFTVRTSQVNMRTADKIYVQPGAVKLVL